MLDDSTMKHSTVIQIEMVSAMRLLTPLNYQGLSLVTINTPKPEVNSAKRKLTPIAVHNILFKTSDAVHTTSLLPFNNYICLTICIPLWQNYRERSTHFESPSSERPVLSSFSPMFDIICNYSSIVLVLMYPWIKL